MYKALVQGQLAHVCLRINRNCPVTCRGSEYSLSTDGGLSGPENPLSSQKCNIPPAVKKTQTAVGLGPNIEFGAILPTQLWIQFLMHKLDEESRQGMTCTLRHIQSIKHGPTGIWSDQEVADSELVGPPIGHRLYL
ncbi:hypothetical protein C8J56DRAFT_890432 [Mycena floridula]|nr:hypothetical protein C8J56DRAFT_890432 [Mycena floridula]